MMMQHDKQLVNTYIKEFVQKHLKLLILINNMSRLQKDILDQMKLIIYLVIIQKPIKNLMEASTYLMI